MLNDNMDFCYALLQTVRFHLHRRKPITECQPDRPTQTMDGGWILVFRFVRMDCVKRQWDEVASIE